VSERDHSRKALLPTYPPSGTAMSTVKKMPRRIMLDTASIPAVQKTDLGLPDKTEVGRERRNVLR